MSDGLGKKPMKLSGMRPEMVELTVMRRYRDRVSSV
jgi:hypothetical protein